MDNLRRELKGVRVLSTLDASKHHNQLTRIINKHNLKSCFPSTIDWPYYRVTDTKMRPSIGLWLTKYHNDAEKNLFSKSILALLTQIDVRNSERENLKTLLEYRSRLMSPLTPLGIDVSLHVSEFSMWWPYDRSPLTNILGEMTANGLMNFHSTTHLSTSLVQLMVAWAYRWSWNWKWDKVSLLVRLLDMLAADWHQCNSQLQFEKHVLGLVQMKQHVESRLHPVILHLHESVWPACDIIWTNMEEELRYLIHLHGKPLRLQELARISICKVVGGQHFKSGLRKLELAQKLKAFVRAHIRRQLLKMVLLSALTCVKCFSIFSLVTCVFNDLIT